MEPQGVKNPLLSKTIWLNVIALIGMFVPAIQAWLAANPEVIVALFAVANIVLRLVTKDKLSLEE